MRELTPDTPFLDRTIEQIHRIVRNGKRGTAKAKTENWPQVSCRVATGLDRSNSYCSSAGMSSPLSRVEWARHTPTFTSSANQRTEPPIMATFTPPP